MIGTGINYDWDRCGSDNGKYSQAQPIGRLKISDPINFKQEISDPNLKEGSQCHIYFFETEQLASSGSILLSDLSLTCTLLTSNTKPSQK